MSSHPPIRSTSKNLESLSSPVALARPAPHRTFVKLRRAVLLRRPRDDTMSAGAQGHNQEDRLNMDASHGLQLDLPSADGLEELDIGHVSPPAIAHAAA